MDKAVFPSTPMRPHWPDRRSGSRVTFLSLWAVASVALSWAVSHGQRTFTLPALAWMGPLVLALTLALLWWLPRLDFSAEADSPAADSGWLGTRVLIAVLLLFPLRALVGRPLFFAIPFAALAALFWLRPRASQREWLYAVGLGAVAGAAGLGAGWITFVPLPVWAASQVVMVIAGLLAGWAILRRTSLWSAGIGTSLFLTRSAASALRGFAQGIVLCLPWALSGIVLGGSNGDQWVQSWWQPLAAIQPGIAEEAWGRVLLVPLLFLAFRPVSSQRRALIAATLVMAYWFAQLHTAGDVGSLFSAALIGTLYALPISYLWLSRGLETAIGFHFGLDLARFAAAYFMNRGLWFGA